MALTDYPILGCPGLVAGVSELGVQSGARCPAVLTTKRDCCERRPQGWGSRNGERARPAERRQSL